MLTFFITLMNLGERISNWDKTQELSTGRYG